VLGAAPLFVAGSTHAGEEHAALDALAAIERSQRAAILVIAPRRVERADEIARLGLRAGRTVRRRTALGAAPLRAGEILLLDTLGELRGLYAHAALAFVGGTLAPVGGHNVLEPVLEGCPVLYGPHTQNVGHAVEILEACGAGRRLRDASELGPAALALLGDPGEARARGRAGRQALESHRGSAERAAELILAALAADAAARYPA
jgi:3-deoxy-D-manno-octulosonic-acid transferase